MTTLAVQPAWQVIPLLAAEWPVDHVTTAEKFRQFIRWHLHHNHTITVCIYRHALAQLMRGFGVNPIGVLPMTDAELIKLVGA